MPQKQDVFVAPLLEGALILAIASIGWAARFPFLFVSVGATAYEQIEKPELESSRPYNVIVGHLVGFAAGFCALWVMHAWGSPKVASAGFVAGTRIWTATIAVALTTLGTLLLRASQPAAPATSLVIALGSMETRRDAIAIVIGILLIAALGEPLRRIRLKSKQKAPSTPSPA